MKKEKLLLILNIFLIIVIGGMGFMMYQFIKEESLECVANPFVYGAGKMSEKHNASVFCDCYISSFPMGRFNFNEKVFNPEPIYAN